MNPQGIKTETEYRAALVRIEKIFDAGPGTVEGDELELLLRSAESYEEIAYPIAPPGPIVAGQFRVEQLGVEGG